MIEVGVEDLVATVLGVRLREHHQLDIGGVATQALETRRAGIRFRLRLSARPSRGVGLLKAGQRARHAAQRLRLLCSEQPRDDRLPPAARASVMRSCSSAPMRSSRRGIQRSPPASTWKLTPRSMRRTAGKATHLCDVGGLARPRRGGARTRHYQQALPLRRIGRRSADRRSAAPCSLAVSAPSSARVCNPPDAGSGWPRSRTPGATSWTCARSLARRKGGYGRDRPAVAVSRQDLRPGSTAGGAYRGVGNCVTLPSNWVILLAPRLLTSSMRSTECMGRKLRLTPSNSLLMRSSRRVEQHARRARRKPAPRSRRNPALRRG